ncbi:CopG family ribbon-helix-helix protein [Roseomonas sp. 18066]|uniref:CopG family ribbon-helix-helix protein n=1 Tax=Roseomonas sp. 18066 TaxID=2681412 RepID=UPI001357174E|nr:CopG family transcriptional regulator [Roseomonas sp. 18066]
MLRRRSWPVARQVSRRATALAEQTITVQRRAGQRAELDRLAERLEPDRGALVTAAVEACLSLHRWRLARIEQGLRQAEAGDFAKQSEIEAVFATPRR